MKKKEIEELFTNEQQFIKLKEELLVHKQKKDLPSYLDLIVPLNFVIVQRSFRSEIQEIHDLLKYNRDYNFDLIHNKIIELLDKISDYYKRPILEQEKKVLEKTFFSQERDQRTLRINHGGGLRNIINFLLNKNEGYSLEGDSRTGLQVHHSDAPDFMVRAYEFYAFRACSYSLDVPAVLEAELDSCYLLHANNAYEAALLPSMVRYLKNIRIIPLNTVDLQTIKLEHPTCKDQVVDQEVFMFMYIFKNTMNNQKFSEKIICNDYQAFLTWWSTLGRTEAAEIIELRRKLETDFAERPVVALPSSDPSTKPSYTPLFIMPKESASGVPELETLDKVRVQPLCRRGCVIL